MLRGAGWENKKHGQQGGERKDNDDLSVAENGSELGVHKEQGGE